MGSTRLWTLAGNQDTQAEQSDTLVRLAQLLPETTFINLLF